MCHPHVTARASDSDTLTDILCAIQILSIEIRVSFLHFTRKYRVRQKNVPLIFSPFSQQPSTSNSQIKCDSVEKRRSYRFFNMTAYRFFGI